MNTNKRIYAVSSAHTEYMADPIVIVIVFGSIPQLELGQLLFIADLA